MDDRRRARRTRTLKSGKILLGTWRSHARFAIFRKPAHVLKCRPPTEFPQRFNLSCRLFRPEPARWYGSGIRKWASISNKGRPLHPARIPRTPDRRRITHCGQPSRAVAVSNIVSRGQHPAPSAGATEQCPRAQLSTTPASPSRDTLQQSQISAPVPNHSTKQKFAFG
jgi:hypothetical protein